MRDAFERALIENPDDLAGWSAYADYLAEHGDPRGEFMQVQLALEDESRSADERKQLQQREAELLAEHENDWLGDLAPFLRDPEAYCDHDERPPECRWRHGFIAGVTLPYLTMASAQLLAMVPAARFLRELRILGTAEYDTDDCPQPQPRVPTPTGIRRHSELFELIGSPCLQSVRVFQMGREVDEQALNERIQGGRWEYIRDYDCGEYMPGIEHVIASMPRIEELHLLCKDYNVEHLFSLPNLTNLRKLRIYHLGVRRGGELDGRYEYLLDVLAQNPALANLTHLLFHPHHEEFHHDHYGQPRLPSFLPLDQVRALLRSKHLKKLTHLQLRLSNMGDEGVRAIIASGILKQLRWLDLRHGCITDEGAKAFAACPDARNLDRLDLSRNAVSSAGLASLRAAKINAVANHPLTEQQLAEEEYLFDGDSE